MQTRRTRLLSVITIPTLLMNPAWATAGAFGVPDSEHYISHTTFLDQALSEPELTFMQASFQPSASASLARQLAFEFRSTMDEDLNPWEMEELTDLHTVHVWSDHLARGDRHAIPRTDLTAAHEWDMAFERTKRPPAPSSSRRTSRRVSAESSAPPEPLPGTPVDRHQIDLQNGDLIAWRRMPGWPVEQGTVTGVERFPTGPSIVQVRRHRATGLKAYHFYYDDLAEVTRLARGLSDTQRQAMDFLQNSGVIDLLRSPLPILTVDSLVDLRLGNRLADPAVWEDSRMRAAIEVKELTAGGLEDPAERARVLQRVLSATKEEWRLWLSEAGLQTPLAFSFWVRRTLTPDKDFFTSLPGVSREDLIALYRVITLAPDRQRFAPRPNAPEPDREVRHQINVTGSRETLKDIPTVSREFLIPPAPPPGSREKVRSAQTTVRMFTQAGLPLPSPLNHPSLQDWILYRHDYETRIKHDTSSARIRVVHSPSQWTFDILGANKNSLIDEGLSLHFFSRDAQALIMDVRDESARSGYKDNGIRLEYIPHGALRMIHWDDAQKIVSIVFRDFDWQSIQNRAEAFRLKWIPDQGGSIPGVWTWPVRKAGIHVRLLSESAMEAILNAPSSTAPHEDRHRLEQGA